MRTLQLAAPAMTALPPVGLPTAGLPLGQAGQIAALATSAGAGIGSQGLGDAAISAPGSAAGRAALSQTCSADYDGAEAVLAETAALAEKRERAGDVQLDLGPATDIHPNFEIQLGIPDLSPG